MLNIRTKGALCKRIRIPEPAEFLHEELYGIRENFAWWIRNPELWDPEYSSRNPESYLRLESRENHSLFVGIQNLSYTDKDWNSVRRMRNPRLGSRFQNCLGLPYLGRKKISEQWVTEKDCDASRRRWFARHKMVRGLAMVRTNFKVLISIFAVFLRFSSCRMGVFVSENSGQ